MNTHKIHPVLGSVIGLSSFVVLGISIAGCSPNKPADESMAPPADQSATPPADQTAPSPADQSAPPADQTAAPSADQAAAPPADQSATAQKDSEQPLDDTMITTKVKAEMLAAKDVAGMKIEVKTVNGVVSLSGDVHSQAEADRAAEVARRVKGVTSVDASGLKVAPGAGDKPKM